MFEGLLPFFLNPDTGLYVTPHPWSNPMLPFAPWVVSVSPIGSYDDLSPITLKTQVIKQRKVVYTSLALLYQDDYESGLLCPWDNEDQIWEYRTGDGNTDFTADDTITVQCTGK